MRVTLYDGRDGTTRSIDVPIPLDEELTLSRWEATDVRSGRARVYGTGVWVHAVYRRDGPAEYTFVGTAASSTHRHPRCDESCVPAQSTTPWPGHLHTRAGW